MIDTQELDVFCLSLLGSRKDFKEEWGVFRYLLEDKMFLMLGHNKEGADILTIKGFPEENRILRKRLPEITPGYYMNKEHWISIPLSTALPQEEVHKYVEISYRLILGLFSKKRQKVLLGETG